MNVQFKNRKIQKVFNSQKLLIKNYGKENAKYIMHRMAVLQAADTLNDVPKTKPDRCHSLTGNKKGQFAVDLKHPYRLVFIPNHEPVPQKDDGTIDLRKVTAILILNVEDYH